MHEGGGRWVGSNKVVELKKKKKILIPGPYFRMIKSESQWGGSGVRGAGREALKAMTLEGKLQRMLVCAQAGEPIS